MHAIVSSKQKQYKDYLHHTYSNDRLNFVVVRSLLAV